MDKKEIELMREISAEEQKMYFDALAEIDYEFYVEYVNEGYRHGQHTKFVCDLLQRAEEAKDGQQKKFIITMPPQHSKSYTITETFPSWYLGRNPRHGVITVGYSSDFAEKFGRKNKEKLQKFGSDIFGVHLGEKQAHKEWELETGGGMISSGFGGQITGKRANCLVGGTEIETEEGKMTIKELVERKDKPKVLSFNHETQNLEYREVIAYRKENSSEIVEITTSSGNKIRCTDRHRFYVMGEGYKEAQNIRPNDRVAHIETTSEQSTELQHMWEEENNRNLFMQKMLSQDKEDYSQSKMRILWGDLFSKIIRSEKEIKEKLRELVLFQRLQEQLYFGEISQRMSSLWREITPSKQILLLFELLWGSNERNEGNFREEEMPRVSERVQTQFFENSILFERLCRQSTLKKNDRETELSLQRWFELFQMVYRNARLYFGKGQPSMCALSTGGRVPDNQLERQRDKENEFNNTPYRFNAGEQHTYKSNNSMQQLSYNNAQIEIVEVERVERVHEGETSVYDIQVEETSNFFAEEILTHNCLLIDDPIKNRAEANSRNFRNQLWDEWESTISTRLAEDAIIVIILTRWHEDDLAGRLLEREGHEWTLVKLPALAEEDDLLGRDKGEALWPEQYSKDYLEKRRKNLSSKAWNSLYMGNPNIEEGNQFKSTYFRYFRENDDKSVFILEGSERKKMVLKKNCVCFQTVDSSFKTSNRNDYTVIATWYVTPDNDLLLYHVHKERLEVPDLWRTLVNISDRFKPLKIFVEDKASGTGLIQKAKREGKPVIPIRAESDKITRSFEISTYYENRAVYHKAETDWVADFEEELNKFPEGTHDDQVDVASIAGIVVSRKMIRAGTSNRSFVYNT